MRRVLACVAMAACALIVGVRDCEATDVHPPTVLPPADVNQIVTRPDGNLGVFFVRTGEDGGQEVAMRVSTDEGRSWSEPRSLFDLPGERWSGALSLYDRDGEVHLFFLKWRGEGRTLGVDRNLDIWHVRSTDGRTRWEEPQRVFAGYVGALMSVCQLESGRIVLPFHYHVPARPHHHPTGQSICTTAYSDDGGATWTLSPAELTAPCFPGYNGNNYGACEPTIEQLADGSVWMLMRTQEGRHFQSWSSDGVKWSPARPTIFHASNSPAEILQLSDGRLVVIWNNCAMPPRVDGAGVYGGRDALHAAISSDGGNTWRGFREIYRDPNRNESPPRRGDRGTAYPRATELPGGDIAVCTGQGGGRRGILLLDPDWLEVTEREDDFSDGLDGWCVFKHFGPASGWWRDRVQGPELVAHPNDENARVLHIRRPDDKPGDGAVWNFPMGRNGTVTIRLMAREGAWGCNIALADRFFNPTDTQGEENALFLLPITYVPEVEAGQKNAEGSWYSLNGGLTEKPRLEAGRWYTLQLRWDLGRRICKVLLDGEDVLTLPLLTATETGPSYLRLRCTAPEVDDAGFLVERVSARVD